MKIIEPSYEVLDTLDGIKILKKLELCGRVCYKSEDKITDESCREFTKMIKTRKHESVLEHVSISVRFICNRGFTHELVRHRIASYSQESTRYCSYNKDKFGNELTFINPPTSHNWNRSQYWCWMDAMRGAEKLYLRAIELGLQPQEARGILPIDIKTEIIITANLREWMHIFSLRCNKAAHPSMRQLMIPLREEFIGELSEIFKKEI